MTAQPGQLSVSVVIVSRHRPAELRRCLSALRFQTLPRFEVVVVADPASMQVIADLGLDGRVKQATFDVPNISQARNIGVGMAAGDVVAFIDDDAVAEPVWLEQLTVPFLEPILGAAGGFVLGRNGIELQWGAEMVGPDGDSRPIDLTKKTTFQGSAESTVKTHGTNCAFRRDTLQQMGGFDEGYHFYLDETDLNVRLGQRGYRTALVPEALVQHGFAPSIRRRADRVPRSLFEMGASQAYFLKRHDRDLGRLDQIRRQHRASLVKHMISGGLEPVSVRKLLQSFDDGVADGLSRGGGTVTLPAPLAPFLLFRKTAPENLPERSIVLYAPRRDQARLFAKAKTLSAQGSIVTAMVFSRTSLFHRRWFHPDGFWVQSGGLYGKSLRSDRYFTRFGLAARAERERALLEKSRCCHAVKGCRSI